MEEDQLKKTTHNWFFNCDVFDKFRRTLYCVCSTINKLLFLMKSSATNKIQRFCKSIFVIVTGTKIILQFVHCVHSRVVFFLKEK